MRPIVAFQGESGAFSEKAVEHLVAGPLTLLPRTTFDATCGAVVEGLADFAVIPVENLIAGPVRAALDALAGAPELEQIAEHELPVRHALLGLAGATVDDIREALSHEMALKQCGRFFEEHPQIRAVEAHDTAGAARLVGIRRDPAVAAIAGAWAAERYGLVVILDGLQDHAENFTRFVLVKRKPMSGRLDRHAAPTG
ncbi:MAG: prephenate dehydratase domain-containing protein [Gemmatimonadaceae bacterium]